MTKRLVLLQGAAGLDLTPWCDQWSGVGSSGDERALPSPWDLGALASFASALVLYDGVVLPNGPTEGRRFIPEWAFGGSIHAFNQLEGILDKLTLHLETYGHTASSNLQSAVYALGKTPSGLGFGALAANALAWQLIASDRSDGSAHLEPLLSGSCAIARCALESQRPAVTDVINQVYSDVLSGFGEIQLPLILATAVSRMNKPTDFIDVLFDLRGQYAKVKERFLEFERIVADPIQPASGRVIRRLYANLSEQLRKSAGIDATPSAVLEEVPSFISLEPASVLRSVIRLARSWTRPELRLLGRWTKSASFDTVGRLRSMFRTRGTEVEWTTAAEVLQTWGTVAWYPGRRVLQHA